MGGGPQWRNKRAEQSTAIARFLAISDTIPLDGE
jgi:hypothetical protein